MKELSWYYMFLDSKPVIERMSADMAKKLWLLLYDYADNGIMPEGLNDAEYYAFLTLKNGVDVAKKHFDTNRERGKKGMEKRWHKDAPETPQKAKEEPKPIEPIESTTKTEKPKKTAFKPPTVEEVKAYCDSRNNGIDAENFVAFYTAKNWFIGKNKMTNWKMAVITWEKNRRPNEHRKEDVTNDRSGYSTDDAADFISYQRELAHSRKT